MKSCCCFLLHLLPLLVLLPGLAGSDAPPANTLPVIAQRPAFYQTDVEFLCLLSWMGFDGIHLGDYHSWQMEETLLPAAEATGMYLVLAPSEILRWGHWAGTWAARLPDQPFTGSSAYGRPLWKGTIIADSLYLGPDILTATFSAAEMDDSLSEAAGELAEALSGSPSVWFFTGFNEAPAWQWARMVHDSTDTDYLLYDDYVPSMFTQAMDSVFRPDLDSTMLWLPTLSEVDPTGVLSWLKYRVEEADPGRELVNTFSLMHTMTDWAGASNYNPRKSWFPPTFADLARSIRSYLSMEYQGYDSPVLPGPVDNHSGFFLVNCYPFRQVGLHWQDSLSYTHLLGDSLDAWLVEHFEEGMDSVFVTAWRYSLDEHQPVRVLFNPQAMGRAGGNDMWDWANDSLDYGSYNYRIPTPQEYLMSCNCALLRQARGFSPHCLQSFREATGSEAGLLDTLNIPFDAPYEEWVYSARPVSDSFFIPPDSYPPFIDTPYDFDPLYDLPARPAMVPGSERNTEDYLVWKFAAYARLWNSMRATNAQIARVAPELAGLSWWDGFEDTGEIAFDGAQAPMYFALPGMKLFGDSLESSCYLFYVNRFCRADGIPFEIVVDAGDLPEGVPYGDRALDHSRRFVLDGTESPSGVLTYLDTLDAGQARLVELFDPEAGLPADLRITRPDVWTISPVTDDSTFVLRQTAGSTVEVVARFYNMGTEEAEGVTATLTDLTASTAVGRDTLNFAGLPTGTGQCRACDFDDAVFSWATGLSDIGAHVLEVRAEAVPGEPDTTDNAARVVFLIEPGDYATEVLEDPWDMTEADRDPPDWETRDVVSLAGYSTWTDSISGMFEAVLDDPSDPNRLYLSTGTGPSQWIDTEEYRYLSLIGKAGAVLDVTLGWMDSDSTEHRVDTDMDLSPAWAEAGPVDVLSLDGAWDDGPAVSLWLELSAESLSPVRVRLGWVRLANGVI